MNVQDNSGLILGLRARGRTEINAFVPRSETGNEKYNPEREEH
ncbi:hypothetical protein AALA82_13040 [Oscillospiraceae bacterium 50-16]